MHVYDIIVAPGKASLVKLRYRSRLVLSLSNIQMETSERLHTVPTKKIFPFP